MIFLSQIYIFVYKNECFLKLKIFSAKFIFKKVFGFINKIYKYNINL